MIDTKNIELHLDDFGNEAEDINKCLSALYSTTAGTQPLDRAFGLENEFLSMPLPVAQNLLSLEIISKTEKYESRVRVIEITYETNTDGTLIPIITVGRRIT